MKVIEPLRSLLNEIRVLPRQLLLETPAVAATVPMLRGTWGAALHGLDQRIYDEVFDPQLSSGQEASPCYVLRPAPPDPLFAPAVEWIAIGRAVDRDAALRRAWDVASGMGLGPQRSRFFIRQVRLLGADGQPAEAAETADGWPTGSCAWRLGEVAWPLADPNAPCRLVFPSPLRILRRKQLIEQPALPDLVVAAARRVRAYLPEPRREAWDTVTGAMLEYSRGVPCGAWQGQRLDLQRYSARQREELELHGVQGFLELPRGPGGLWPLLAAARWLHLGKGTVMGLGRMEVEGG